MQLGRWRSFAAVGAALTLLTAAGRLHAQGTITGKVISQAGGQPLPEARIIVVGGTASASTGEDGKFTLRNVAVGNVQLQVLRVGYQSQKKTVSVASATTTVADFALGVAVAQLEEVVTTATGQQRKVELGNAISTLGDVGKRVETSEISNVTDLMIAKSPGVSVLPSPVQGGAPTIRIRGISSISLSNAPIWVVDGVRYNVNNPSTSSGQTPITLLNNLSPEEIEDIEIVKGPSAATLYGTNAANGVIVVTTKKGRAGATHWNWVAESRTIDDRNHYQAQYANFGHTPANPNKEIRCQLPVMVTPQFSIAQGAQCISDSLTHYDPFSDPTNTMIGLGRGSLFGLNVSGGNEAVRYFTSASLDNEFGAVQMPSADIRFFQDSLHQTVTDAMLHPRNSQKVNVRTNLSASLSPKFDLTANAGFGKSDISIEPDNSLLISMLYVGQAGYGYKGCPKGTEKTGCGLDKPYADPTGFPLHDNKLVRARLDHAVHHTGRRPAHDRQPRCELAPAHMDAERGQRRRRLRRCRCIPRLQTERVSEFRRDLANRQRHRSKTQLPHAVREVLQHGHVAGACMDELEDLSRRGLYQRRERFAQRAGSWVAPGRFHTWRNVDLRQLLRDGAECDQDARLLRAGTDGRE
jgi:TonB-dependent SusC/RagA subfamily outer membrane receptor